MSDLISREALLKAMEEEKQYLLARGQRGAEHIIVRHCLPIIDNAPTADDWENYSTKLWDKAYSQGYGQAMSDARNSELTDRPKGEREFIEILAQDVPDDLCTYPEYKGKPYYSIHYKQNGEDFVGFGTYKPEVLSRFLRDYFLK